MLILGTDDTLDADDCLAQMIFHELCHSLVQGPAGLRERDWGLDNLSDQDTEREHATLRVQASLAQEYGLRRVLGPTTDFRGFYDALPSDPLEGASQAERDWALAGLARVATAPWSPHLREALSATQRVVAAAAPFASAYALYALYDPTTRGPG